MKKYYVYIVTNYNKTVLYIGVTDNLQRRIWEHENGTNDGFTKKYSAFKLVCFEIFNDIEQAIAREKQLKHWNRTKKEDLIFKYNPDWKDLSKDESFSMY
jgi:putative endonuclease